jgi:hypothetical protein
LEPRLRRKLTLEDAQQIIENVIDLSTILGECIAKDSSGTGPEASPSHPPENQNQAAEKKSRQSPRQIDLLIHESAMPEGAIKGLIDDCFVPALLDKFLKERMAASRTTPPATRVRRGRGQKPNGR